MVGLEDVADVLATEMVAGGFGKFDKIEGAGGEGVFDGTGVGGEDAGEKVEEGGFAGPAGTEESDLFAGGERERIDINDGDGRAFGGNEGFAELSDVEHEYLPGKAYLYARGLRMQASCHRKGILSGRKRKVKGSGVGLS